MSPLAIGAIAFYVVLLLLMLAYGTNTVLLVVIHALNRHRARSAPPPPDRIPRVTVQLPVYNEENVVVRLLESVGNLDWPADRLEIQLLDDSTDRTPEVAAPVVARLQARGLDVTHIRRHSRAEYKAGALKYGMARCKGEFIAVFDADFAPTPEFLRKALGRFADPRVAAVQGRWTHLNREHSGLTRAEALAIDGHFGVEQAARYWAGWFLNFNGSAGVWRRAAIEDAGGWSGDTLTEDLDLSYRVQLCGWKMVYDTDLVCPSELPVDLAAFKAQQRRWATGSMQTARKLLPSIWRSGASLASKVQATLHLTHYAVHLLIALTALLSVPCVLWPGASIASRSLWTLLLPFALAMSGPTLLHIYAQRVLEGRNVRFRDLGLLTLFGIGIAVSNGRAVLEAFRGPGGEFVRTPKLGIRSRAERPANRYRVKSDGLLGLETGLALYCVGASLGLAWVGVYEIAPFMMLDAAGFAAVAVVGHAEARAAYQA
jgi:cellulose synthase/poly-beta-1,6-N-acetylglucosamine synthase-like glycosyltransferase